MLLRIIDFVTSLSLLSICLCCLAIGWMAGAGLQAMVGNDNEARYECPCPVQCEATKETKTP